MRGIRALLSRRSVPRGILIALFLYAFWRHLSSTHPTNVSALFSNLMALLSIFSGFVASFYFFVASRGNIFLARIDNTQTYEDLLTLTKVSLELSFVAIVYTFFLSGYAPISQSANSWDADTKNLCALIGFGLAGLTVSNFIRCMRLFLKLTSPTGGQR